MITQFCTIAYGHERQANGKYKLFRKEGDGEWRMVMPDHRRHFHEAINEFAETYPEGTAITSTWDELDYDLPPTPWDWMKDDDLG
ncbi:hypothetical protein [Azospirillum argentinense]